jgi:hypothetical protein
MTDQINVKDLPDTPEHESLPYRIGFLAARYGKRNGRRMSKSEVVRQLINNAYQAEKSRRAQPAGDTEAQS